MIEINININYQSKVTIYEQIADEVIKQVCSGVIPAGSQIPSIRDLAGELGINPNTVKKSYDYLESLGVIETRSTRGTYITQNTDNVVNLKVNELFNELSTKVSALEKLGVSKKEIIAKINRN